MLDFTRIPSLSEVVSDLQSAGVERATLSEDDLIKEVQNLATTLLKLHLRKDETPEQFFQWFYLCKRLDILMARATNLILTIKFPASIQPNSEDLKEGGWYISERAISTEISISPFI